jgi:cyclic pyranopterin phosphate synthase
MLRGNGLCGMVGTIAPVTEPFCGDCRRLRITADGRLYPCLLSPINVDLRPLWYGGYFDEDFANRIIRDTVWNKSAAGASQSTAMVTLGG